MVSQSTKYLFCHPLSYEWRFKLWCRKQKFFGATNFFFPHSVLIISLLLRSGVEKANLIYAKQQFLNVFSTEKSIQECTTTQFTLYTRDKSDEERKKNLSLHNILDKKKNKTKETNVNWKNLQNFVFHVELYLVRLSFAN